MLQVKFESGNGSRTIFTNDNSLSPSEFWENLENLGYSKSQFYALQNGRLVSANNEKNLQGFLTILPRLVGGKGGFGSMLRAIGAQIEKTTNREACRDLSGRRLRDINEEKRLKAWIDKKDTREEEAAERKKKKLERLCTEPKHDFKDKNYEHERSVLTEKIDSAVEEGFKVAQIIEKSDKKTEVKKGIKRKTILDDDFDDIDSDELSSSDEDDDDKQENKNLNKKKKIIIETKGNNSAGNSTESSSSSSDPENEDKNSSSSSSDEKNLKDEIKNE